MPAVPSLALGTGEVSLLRSDVRLHRIRERRRVAAAGRSILRIEDRDGRVLYRGQSVGRRVLSESTAYLMASMLRRRRQSRHRLLARARADSRCRPAARPARPTITRMRGSSASRRSLAAGVWVGFDQPQEIMRRGFASVVAVPAWAGFMKAATTGNKPEWLEVPSGVSHIRRCRASGGLANEYCELTGEVDDDYVVVRPLAGHLPAPYVDGRHHRARIAAPAPAMSISIAFVRPPQN